MRTNGSSLSLSLFKQVPKDKFHGMQLVSNSTIQLTLKQSGSALSHFLSAHLECTLLLEHTCFEFEESFPDTTVAVSSCQLESHTLICLGHRWYSLQRENCCNLQTPLQPIRAFRRPSSWDHLKISKLRRFFDCSSTSLARLIRGCPAIPSVRFKISRSLSSWSCVLKSAFAFAKFVF